MRIEEYLDAVCAKIKWKEARKPVRIEMEGHIAQRVEEYIANGDSPEHAEERAVANMGDAVQTGLALNKLHRPRVDWILIGALALLLGLGVFYTTTTAYLTIQVWITPTILGLSACALLSMVDMRRVFHKHSMYVVVFLIFLAAVLLDGFIHHFRPPEHAGLHNDTPFSAICSIGMILSAGVWVSQIKNNKQFVLFLLAIFAAVVAFAAKPSATIAITVLFCTWVMLWSVNMKNKKILLITTTAMIAFFIASSLVLYFNGIDVADTYMRYDRFFRSFDTSSNGAYYLNQARLSVSGLNWFGHGSAVPGFYNDYPLPYDDYALLGFMRECGIAAGAAVVGLCGVVLWRVYRILLCIKDRVGRTMTLGLCTYVTVQIVLCVLINFGIMPNVILSFIPMFTLVWQQTVVLGIVLGLLIGLYRKSDLYSTEYRTDTTSNLSKA